MNSEILHALLDELIGECREHDVEGRIDIFGGAAIIHYFPRFRSTVDVDAMYSPYRAIRKIAEGVGVRHDLPHSWFNSSIHDVMPPCGDDGGEVYYDDGKLKVCFASPAYLLAMKANSRRRSEKDLRDSAVLMNHIGLRNVDEIEALVARYYGSGAFGSQELFFEDICEEAAHMRSIDT